MNVADPSIYSLIRPPAPIEGPLDQYAKVENLKALMGQSRIHNLQAQQLEGNLAEENAARDYLKNLAPGMAPTSDEAVSGLMRIAPNRAIAMQKAGLDASKTRGESDKIQQEIAIKALAQHRDALAGVDTPEAAAQWLQAGFADPRLVATMPKGATLDQSLANLAKATQTPEAFNQWKQQNALGATKFIEQNKPHITTQDTGGTSNIIATPGLGGAPQVLSSTAKTPTPGEVLSRQSAVEGHGITLRGQNMTDARQRELNGILEGQSGAPSPALVKSIANHEIELRPPPTNARLPGQMQRYGQLLEAVKQENPNWSADQYPAVKKAEAAFSTGKESHTIRALSNATGHLDTYERLALAMKNGDSQGVNAIVNKVKEQFGSEAPTNPQVVARFLSGEIVKAAAGAAGTGEDRAKMESSFANKTSPAQMVGAANTAREIMGQQFRSLEQQYKAGTYGRKDFADKYLTLPEVRSAYDKAIKGHSAQPAAKPGGLVATVRNDDDFAKLPSGAIFIAPDGTTRTKP